MRFSKTIHAPVQEIELYIHIFRNTSRTRGWHGAPATFSIHHINFVVEDTVNYGSRLHIANLVSFRTWAFGGLLLEHDEWYRASRQKMGIQHLNRSSSGAVAFNPDWTLFVDAVKRIKGKVEEIPLTSPALYHIPLYSLCRIYAIFAPEMEWNECRIRSTRYRWCTMQFRDVFIFALRRKSVNGRIRSVQGPMAGRSDWAYPRLMNKQTDGICDFASKNNWGFRLRRS